MNPLAKFLREVRRLLCERVTMLFIASTTVGALWFCLNSAGRTASDAYILEAAKNSAFWGALFFTLLTLTQFHRDYKNKTDSIVFTSTDPIFYQLRRTLALICAAIITALIVTLFALPYALIKTGVYFQADAFAASWYLIFLGALVLSILLSSGLYLLLRRVDAAFVIMVGLIILSNLLEYQYDLNPSYLLFWVQTNATGFSDLISNQFQIDLILWNRLFCMLTALSVWFFGMCSLRRYERGFWGSFLSNARRAWIPVFFTIAVVLSGVSYAGEPIFDDSIPLDYGATYNSGTGIAMFVSGSEEEGNTNLLLTDKNVELSIDTTSRTVTGKALYILQNLTEEAQHLSVLVNTGYTIKDALVNDQPAEAVRDDAEEGGNATWRIELPDSSEYEVELRYSGKVQNNGTLGQNPTFGICDEYISLPSTGFSPSADTTAADNCSFTGTLYLDEHLEPVFTRVEGEKGETVNGKTKWQFSTNSGIERTGLDAAEYHTKIFEAGGLNIKFKYFAKQDGAIANMDTINVMKAAIDYFTKTFGPLPYEDHLTVLELPASFCGGGAFGNISAMDETSFAVAGYLPNESDAPHSGGGVDVLVHELAHQWWGLATCPIYDGTSYWSAEGITCYSTYRFMEYYFGADYANEHYINEWHNNWDTYKNAFYIQNPEYLAKLSANDASNVMSSLNSIGLYDIMPLGLLKAETAVGGPEAFQNKLSELYQSYLGNCITYDDFLSVTELTKEVLKLA